MSKEFLIDNIENLREENEKLRVENARLREALELIAKNKTEDCDIYTMGCDCDEEAIKALKEADESKGED